MFYTKPPFTITNIQLSAMDVLVLTTMKNAAKCDTKSELQNPVNLYVFERMLRFRVLLEACLFECLFSPLAVSLCSSKSRERLADCGAGPLVPFVERGVLRSSGETTKTHSTDSVFRRDQCGDMSSRRNKILTSSATAGSETLRIVRPSLVLLPQSKRRRERTQLSDLKSGKRTR